MNLIFIFYFLQFFYGKSVEKSKFIGDISPILPTQYRNFEQPTIVCIFLFDVDRYPIYRRYIGRYFRFFNPWIKKGIEKRENRLYVNEKR